MGFKEGLAGLGVAVATGIAPAGAAIAAANPDIVGQENHTVAVASTETLDGVREGRERADQTSRDTEGLAESEYSDQSDDDSDTYSGDDDGADSHGPDLDAGDSHADMDADGHGGDSDAGGVL